MHVKTADGLNENVNALYASMLHWWKRKTAVTVVHKALCNFPFLLYTCLSWAAVQIFVSALVFIKQHQIQDALTPKEQIHSVHSNQNVYRAEYLSLCEQDIKVIAGGV